MSPETQSQPTTQTGTGPASVPRAIARRLLQLLRVSALAVVIAAVSLLALQDRVRALGERVLLGAGQHMMRYPDAANQTGTTRLLINGAAVFMNNGATDASVGSVLDHFHARCIGRNGQLASQWAEAIGSIGDVELPAGPALLDGVMRIETPSQGVVACIDVGSERLEPAELLRRMEVFLETGDASHVGDLRYVMARRGSRRTVFLTVWTEGSVNLQDMFPESGDAPGSDTPGVPRPAGSRRLLSTRYLSDGSLLNVYETPGGSEDLPGFYRSRLVANGWTVSRADGQLVVAYSKQQMVTISADEGAVVVVSRPMGALEEKRWIEKQY